MSVYLGVDPGKTGALAAVNHWNLLLFVDDMPDPLHGALVRGLLDEPHDQYRATIEQVHSMPGQGVASTFKFGDAYGLVRGALEALLIPVQYVTPTKWKRDLGLGPYKDQSRTRAIQLWPEHADLFKRKRDDGRAEAALIAYWCMKQHERQVA